jgi:hypothetical protein
LNYIIDDRPLDKEKFRKEMAKAERWRTRDPEGFKQYVEWVYASAAGASSPAEAEAAGAAYKRNEAAEAAEASESAQ